MAISWSNGPRRTQVKDKNMKPGIPWSVKGIEPEAREAAKLAARRAGLTLGEWLNSVIFDQSAHKVGATHADSHLWDDFVSSAPPPEPPRPEPDTRSRPPRAPAAQGQADNALRLQDIAQQLADLAKRERQTVPPAAPPPRRSDRDEFDRIVERIEDNERQTVEALTAVNDRLSRLSQQISAAPRPRGFERPEEVPGYSALESAIRNVVEHIEVSEKRTRDSLRTMQDRIADVAERGGFLPSADDILRAAPVLSGLEQRLAEMVNRIQRSEGLLTERIEGVKASAQQMANQAQSSAVTAVRGELREVETRMLASLKEAQAAASNTPPLIANEIARLHGDMAGLAKRLDDVKAASASERDMQSLRVAIEQLSTRVAQGPDMRPLADMDKRLGDINRRLEMAAAASRDAPQVGALEQRIAELDHRLAEAMRLQGDQRAVQRLEESLAAVNARVAQTEQQLGHLEAMEQAIRQLYDSIEQTRSSAADAAEAAASRALERFTPPPPSGPSAELQALEDGLRAVRESVSGVERRNQDTFQAVHETLSEIVEKISEIETAARAPAPAMAQPAPPPPPVAEQLRMEERVEPRIDMAPVEQPSAAAMAPEPETAPAAAPPREPLSSGDDFIAAARRAAQAASARPSALRAEYGAQSGARPEKNSSSFLQRVRGKREQAPSAAGPDAEAPRSTRR
jgi:localization factor PodJL